MSRQSRGLSRTAVRSPGDLARTLLETLSLGVLRERELSFVEWCESRAVYCTQHGQESQAEAWRARARSHREAIGDRVVLDLAIDSDAGGRR